MAGPWSLSLLLVGCATSARVRITSVPEASTVSLKGPDGSTRVLGKTPVDLDSRDLGAVGRLAVLEVSQEGFQEQQILLARDRGSENYDISLRLKKHLEDPKSLDARTRQEKLARSVAQASNLINNKRFDEARVLLNNVIVEYPHVSVGFDLMGGLAFLQRDLKAALGYYERSLTINPENVETRQIVTRLRGMVQ